MAGEFSSLVLVYGVRNVRAGPLDLDSAATGAARTTGMATGTLGNDARRLSRSSGHALLRRRRHAKFRDELETGELIRLSATGNRREAAS